MPTVNQLIRKPRKKVVVKSTAPDMLENPQKRFSEFVGYTDSILEDCSMGKLYIANPYECFLLLCILTDCPLGTYAEVFEKSYLEGTE